MEFDREAAEATIRKAAEKCPTSFVTRPQVPTFTGGLYSAGTMANMDSEGRGPKGSFRIGRKRCYPVDALCEWLIDRLEVVLRRHKNPEKIPFSG